MTGNLPRDMFRPRHEPAATLYDAFQAEAAKRKGRTVEQWQAIEENAVWAIAKNYAMIHNLYAPTPLEIHQASTYASGSVDYGAKWVYRIVELMVPLKSTETER